VVKNPISVYVNFPFCDGCSYCTLDEHSSVFSRRKTYVQALVNEIKSKAELAKGKVVSSVFFGGQGTCIMLSSQIKIILDQLRKTFILDKNCEITIEVLPSNATSFDLEEFKEIGITRISLAMLSMDDIVLGVLGKSYTVDDLRLTLDALRDFDFKVNIDLTVGIPVPKNVSQMNLRRSPEVELSNLLVNYPFIGHVSIYEIEIEDGTDLARNIDYEQVMMQSHDEFIDDIVLIHGVLEEFGFKQYDSHHWATEGQDCIYNRSHVEIDNECFAFGVAASGLVNNIRYNNFDELDLYLLSPDKVEQSTPRTTLDKVNEAITYQLGTPNGVDLAALRNLGVDIMVLRQKEITQLRALKLIKATKNTLCMTKAGALLVNYALSELLFDEADLAQTN